MKKERTSSVKQQHGAILAALEEQRQRLVNKSIRPQQTGNKHKRDPPTKSSSSLNVPQKSNPAKIYIDTLPCLEDRARENVRQWGNQAKIDVEKIKILAAKLKSAKTAKPTTCIRYINTNGVKYRE